MASPHPNQSCSLLRRLGAIFYDTLLLFSLLLFASIPALIINGGVAISPNNYLYQIYLLAICSLYFLLPWRIKGQTLGMQSWKIKLISEVHSRPSWPQLFGRLIASLLSWLPFGLGYLWSLFDQQKLAWHDHLSKTRLIHDPTNES